MSDTKGEKFFDDIRREVSEFSADKEVQAMLLEYTAEGHMKELQDESYENGVNNTNALYSWLYDNDREADVRKAVSDPAYLDELFKEFSKIKNNCK